MKNLRFGFLLGLCALYLFGCQTSSQAPAEGWTVGVQPYIKRYCINPEDCAEFKVYLPQYRGEQSATLGAFNERIQRHLLTILQPLPGLPIDATLDSLSASFFKQYTDFKRLNTQKTENWQLELIASVPVLTPQITTVEARQKFVVLNNQKSEMLHVITYDFRSEKYLSITDLVADTAALRPLLELAFTQARGLKSVDGIQEILLPTLDRLPMPRYAAVYSDGIRIVYNYSEYALIELPVTDFRLRWEELGALADRSKWLLE